MALKLDDDDAPLSHARLIALARSSRPTDRAVVDRYLTDIAQDFSAMQVLAVMALVDTPDVLD